MQPGGGEANQLVPGLDPAPVDNPAALHRSYGKARQVILPGTVKTGHFRCLSANQSTSRLTAAFSHTVNDGGHFFRNQPAHCQVVQEKKGFRPLYQDIVYTHGHRVNTNGIVAIRQHSHPEFGADPVRS